MKRMMLHAALVFSMALCSYAPGSHLANPGPATVKAAEDEIKKIEQEMLDALLKGDASANEKYMAENYVFTSPDGMVMGKKKAVDDLKSGDLKFESSVMDDFKVIVLGNTAVATYRTTDKGSYKKEDLSGQYRWTDTFVMDKGKWKLLAGQGTPLKK